MEQRGAAAVANIEAAGANAHKLQRTPLRDQAVEVLRDMISDGDLQVGRRINEVELAATLGISRGPLREAIQRLSAEGLIEFQRNRGAYVRDVSPDEVAHMYELRVLLEVPAARYAAERATDQEIQELRDQVRTVEKLLSSDPKKPYPSEVDFHTLLLDLSKNPYLQRAGRELQTQIRIARLRSGNSPERAREALAEHRDILDAVANRDVEAAGDAMREHLERSLSSTVRSEEKAGL